MIKKAILLFSVVGINLSAQTDTTDVLINKANPIELSFFDVVPREDHVFISWGTTKETNNAYFTIEKSKDNKHYTKVIDIPGAGTSTIYKEYAETDYQPYNGSSYYHIKQTDFDGTIRYFPKSGVIFNGKKETKAYPTQAEITMMQTGELTELKNKEVLVVLQDAEGNNYIAKLVITKENDQLFAEDIDKTTPPGIYIVLSTEESSIYSHRIIVR